MCAHRRGPSTSGVVTERFLDKNLKFKEYNKRFEKLLGYSDQEIVDKSIFDYIHKEDFGLLQRILTSRLGGTTNPIMIRFISKDNHSYWSETVIQVLSDFILIIARDISKQKEIQEELIIRNKQLEEEKMRTSAMLENIGDGIIGINDKGEITFINNQTRSLLGYTEEELKGKMLIHTLKLLNEKGDEVLISDRPIHKALLNKSKITISKYLFLYLQRRE